MEKPFVIIVSGLPASGKTSLAEKLAEDFKLPLVTKDGIKESLFDTLGWRDREWSKKLGNATYAILFYFIEQMLKAGCSFIVESNFHADFANHQFNALNKKYPFTPFQVQCHADGEVLVQRYKERSKSGKRHPGHLDELGEDELAPQLLKGKLENLDIGGEIYELETTDFDKIDYAGLNKAIKAAMKVSSP